MEYIDWAVSQKFDVMDINVPQHIVSDEVMLSDIGNTKSSKSNRSMNNRTRSHIQ
jgi:hypothetical protein